MFVRVSRDEAMQNHHTSISRPIMVRSSPFLMSVLFKGITPSQYRPRFNAININRDSFHPGLRVEGRILTDESVIFCNIRLSVINLLYDFVLTGREEEISYHALPLP